MGVWALLLDMMTRLSGGVALSAIHLPVLKFAAAADVLLERKHGNNTGNITDRGLCMANGAECSINMFLFYRLTLQRCS